MPALFSLFNILALLYLLRSIQLSVTIWRERATVRQEPLTPRKKYLAEQAAFFIAVPAGVFVHELGHAVAVWLSGGQVTSFGYRVFWGYVVPSGSFTPTQDWFIALAGTLGSLLFGLVAWLILRRSPTSSLRYFGLRTLRFQVYFSLIYYPLFTLVAPIGDWRTIYDFTTTPLLSSITAVAHAGLLLLFWQGDRQGWFEAPGFTTLDAQREFAQLAAEASAHPDDPQRQMAVIDALRRSGAPRRAHQALHAFQQQQPHSAVAHLQLAALEAEGRGQVSRKSADYAQEALALGLDSPRQRAYAHQLLGQYHFDANHPQTAVDHLTQAITAVAAGQNQLTHAPNQATYLAELYLMRSHAYRRQKAYEPAYEDLQRFQALAQQGDGSAKLLARYQQELTILQKHAGRRFDQPTNASTPRQTSKAD